MFSHVLSRVLSFMAVCFGVLFLFPGSLHVVFIGMFILLIKLHMDPALVFEFTQHYRSKVTRNTGNTLF